MPDTQSSKPNTREAILDAAEAVVTEEGAGRLTIDAVVARSGFSKGGVLYHFPSKIALLEGMVARLMGAIEHDLEAAETAARKAGDPVASHWLRVIADKRHLESDLPVALLAASAEQPHLLDPARALNQRLWERIREASNDPIQALILLLVIDGLSFNDLIKFKQFTDADRAAVKARLIAMSEDLFQ